jgi:hypothetical protein
VHVVGERNRGTRVEAGHKVVEGGVNVVLQLVVLGVDVDVDDGVAEALEGALGASDAEVRRAEVGRPDANDADEGVLELRHLGCDVGGRQRGEVGVGPTGGGERESQKMAHRGCHFLL